MSEPLPDLELELICGLDDYDALRVSISGLEVDWRERPLARRVHLASQTSALILARRTARQTTDKALWAWFMGVKQAK